MTKPVLSIDIDDVLLTSEEALLNHHNEHYKPALAYEDMVDGITDALLKIGVKRDDIVDRMERFQLSHAFDAIPPTQEAMQALRRLQIKYDLVAITGRASHLEEQTIAWIAKHFPGTFQSLHVVGGKHFGDGFIADKIPLMKELGVVAMVDDGLRNCLRATEAGIRALLFGDYPWNQIDEMPPGMKRVMDWDAVLEELL